MENDVKVLVVPGNWGWRYFDPLADYLLPSGAINLGF